MFDSVNCSSSQFPPQLGCWILPMAKTLVFLLLAQSQHSLLLDDRFCPLSLIVDSTPPFRVFVLGVIPSSSRIYTSTFGESKRRSAPPERVDNDVANKTSHRATHTSDHLPNERTFSSGYVLPRLLLEMPSTSIIRLPWTSLVGRRAFLGALGPFSRPVAQDRLKTLPLTAPNVSSLYDPWTSNAFCFSTWFLFIWKISLLSQTTLIYNSPYSVYI